MSMDKDLVLIAEFFQTHFNIGYTHEEFIALLAKIKDGYVLTETEYRDFKSILLDNKDPEEDDDLFSGDYNDLINLPDIPTNLQQLAGYSDFINKINNEWAELKATDSRLNDRINATSLFIKNIEVVVKKDIERLEQLIKTITMFDGESLESIIKTIRTELGWLQVLSEGIEEGRILSERNFTSEYEEILEKVYGHPEGLEGVIKNVIAESIVDPGTPNTNDVYRLDSIGEALNTKVDKQYGYGLSEYNFSGQYKEILDTILGKDGSGSIIDYVEQVVINNVGDISNRVESSINENKAYVDTEIDNLKDIVADRLDEMDNIIAESKEHLLDGLYFKEDEGPASVTLGGLRKDTKLAGRTVHDVLLEILCPYVAPKVTAKLILGDGQNYLSQIGTIVQVKGISVTITKGSAPISKIIYKQKVGNTYQVIGSYNNMTTTHWIPDVFEATKSITADTFIVEVHDATGKIVTSNTERIDIIYPTYYGPISTGTTIIPSTIQQLTGALVRSGETIKIKYTTQNQRMAFAIPQSNGIVSEVYDQNGYLITNSFEVKQIECTFSVKEYVGNTTQTQIKTYKEKYNVYYSNPNTVTKFEITIKL